MSRNEGLIGRIVELERIRTFIVSIGRDESVLVLSGDPGLGKTALLDGASRTAETAGPRSLRVTTNEYEGGISFAALNQCIGPLTDHLEDLAQPHRRALSVALGLRSGPPAAPLVLASAVVMLFRRAALEQPLLVIVDDLQWVDRASAGVLALVARRLEVPRSGCWRRTAVDGTAISIRPVFRP